MSSKIEFTLFAPYNKDASLKGSFSGWKKLPMLKSNDGNFRIKVDLADGVYEYKYEVCSKSWFLKLDEWVDVIDPYATDINSKEQNAVIKIKNGKRIVDDYVWRYDKKVLPSDRELVIYELHIADFSGGESDSLVRGKYLNVIEKLNYLTDLGINAIELMPINEYPGKYSWGYNPKHFFATETSYGTTAELKQLIDECHARGIRVILDAICNHSEASAPLTKIDHNYWYHEKPQDPQWSWGPQFNYDFYDEELKTYPARKFMGDVLRYWVKEFHIDGIRYDSCRQVENYDFMNWIVKEGKAAAGMKPFYNIAEFVPMNVSITGANGPMDACWHDTFCYCIREHLFSETFDIERLKDVIDPRREGLYGATNVVNYLTNHDHNHLLADLGAKGIMHEAAFNRIKLGASILMTAMGIPMLWMGEEFGECKTKRLESNKIDWTLLKNDLNKDLLGFYKGLINLRRNNHALYGENIDFFHTNPDGRVLAYIRWNDQGSRVAVVINFSDRFYAGYKIANFPNRGAWHEWTSDYDINVGENDFVLDLPPWEAKVFVWRQA